MRLLAFLATLLLLAPVPVSAQSSSGGGLGGVLDTLGGIVGLGTGRIHGHVVMAKGDTLVVRSDDGRTLSVDVSRTDQRLRGVLKPGDGVTLTMRQPREGEPKNQALIANDLQLDPPSKAGKTFQRVEGNVLETGASRMTFRTREGFTLPLDVSKITGLPQLSNGQPATLFYEPDKQGVVAVWIEPGSVAQASKPAPAPPPAASPDTGVQRFHGLVDSVTLSGFTLTSDDGRKLTVETKSGASQDIRPGDMVTVFGRAAAGRADAIVAEFVHQDSPRR